MIPPPPPRPLAINNQHGMVPPPPPGPPPGGPQNPLSSGWAQQNQWARQQQGYIPPPPPLNAHQYSTHPAYQQNLSPAPLNIPPPPPPQQQHLSGEPNLVSATYIPGGESFGPGVGIPPLYSYQHQDPSLGRDDSFSYSSHEAKLLQDQRFYNGPSSAISARGDLPSFPGTTPVSQTPLTRQQNSFRSNSDNAPQTAQTPMSATQETPVSAHNHSSSNSGVLSPNDPGSKWPLDKVLVWLAVNGFSNDWQETFKGLDIHGSDFLDLGRGNNGRGNFGMMHQLVYPRLARECGKSGSGWNQDRERNEGRRMRRLVRKMAEGAEEGPTGGGSGGHVRRESINTAPSASTDGGVESSPSQTPHTDGFSNTPSTAGGEDSPRGQFRSTPSLNPRMNSKTRSSTAPIPVYSQGGASSSETGLADISKSGSNRSAKSILNNINDAASKRHHSPSASETGGSTSTSTFIGNAIRGSYDSSPQSGSPARQHAQISASSGSGTLSAPPNGRGHRKNNSSDSMASNPTSNSVTNLLRGPDRRNGYDHRPPMIDVASKVSSDTPTSARELSKGFLDRFRKRKKDDSSHPSPEDQSLESPTSPLNYKHMPPTLPFARGKNGSSTSLERPGSASTQMSEQERLRQRDRDLTRSGGGRRYAFVTPDQWNYRLVDLTEADNAEAVREAVCKVLNYSEHDMALIYLTEPGQVEHDEPLTDAFLMMSKHTKGDSHGSLKYYVRRGPTSASLPPPLSAGLGIGMSPKASPPPGSLFPRKALDEDGYARIRGNGQTRSKSPPMNSRQNTLKSNDATPKDNTLKQLDIPDGNDIRLTESPPETAKQRLQSMSVARKSGSISEPEWGAYLAAAIEEHRLEMERQGKEYRLGRLAAGLPSPNRLSTGSTREINFDDPNRGSPYDRVSKPDPLVPLRKPPAPPPGSTMLEKANSLTRKQGESLRSSIASQSDLMKRLSKGETIAEESEDRGRRKAVAATSSDSGGGGSAMVGASNAVITAGPPIGSRRNLPLRDSNERNQSKQTVPSLQTVGFGRTSSGRSSPGSPKSPGDITMGKNSMAFKIPDYHQGSTATATNGKKPSLALQTQVAKNPSIEKMKTVPDRSVSPGSQNPPSRKGSLASRPKSYGPNFAFKEMEVMFEQKPPLPGEQSDGDSDDGLFAKPLAKTLTDNPLDSRVNSISGDENPHRRPTLKVNTNDQRPQKTRSVSFKTPDTSTTASTTQSSDTPDLDDEGHPIGKLSEEKQPVEINSTPGSTIGSRPALSPDSMAAKIARRQSFARDDVWANRPPAEDLLNNLDAFFPNLDLDQPVVEDLAGSPPVSPEASAKSNPLDSAANGQSAPPSRMIRSSLYDRVRPESIAEEPDGTLGSEESTLKSRAPIESDLPSVAQRSMRKSGGLGRMKSIRDVARGAYEGSSKRNTRVSTGPVKAKSGDIVRRKSTKMFGANIVQIKPGRGSRVSLIESVPKDLPPGTNSFQIGRGQLIGKGSYGRVYLGINLTTGDFLAVKQVEVNQKTAGQDKNKIKEMVAALDQEIDTMQHLEHPNIVQYLGCERKEYSISIFLEYISGGSVGSCLRKHGKFEESLVSSLTRQTLAGLAYLHQEGVLHRDLKADNILLDTNGTCKISDFGISKKTDNIYGNDVTNSMQGSVFWMAPEVIRSKGQGYSAKVDIWSLGCVVLEMFAGRRPWSKEEAIGAIYKLGELNQAPPIPDDVSSSISAEAVAFMLDCFTVDPSERPTAATLLRGHPFCRGDPYYNFLDTELHAKLEEANRGIRYEGQS